MLFNKNCFIFGDIQKYNSKLRCSYQYYIPIYLQRKKFGKNMQEQIGSIFLTIYGDVFTVHYNKKYVNNKTLNSKIEHEKSTLIAYNKEINNGNAVDKNI